MRRIKLTTRKASTNVAAILIAVVSLGGAAFLAAQPRSSSPPAADQNSSAAKAGHARALAIRVKPRSRSVSQGGVAQFRIRIRRTSPVTQSGRRPTVKLRILRGLPPGATATFMRKRTRNRISTLTVDTGSAAIGIHRMRIRARSNGKHATALARLTIAPVQSADFQISADSTTPLAPGVSVPVDLTLTNPQTREIAITSLDARVSNVTAPGASPGLPCTVDDFAVIPFSGAYGFEVAAAGTTSLSKLDFPSSEWPQLKMLDRPVNQDGCKDASLTLAYGGTSTVGAP
ncbi:MAG: hypothetical protein QOI31_1946 [Solirubrobacterales bacterium]|jgi:hypothetical protein|nr:hypothetical protein [Solirubrobacterales bacterium]